MGTPAGGMGTGTRCRQVALSAASWPLLSQYPEALLGEPHLCLLSLSLSATALQVQM